MGDLEQSATDLLKDVDFTHLIAMMAPRPTLLAYNESEDDCRLAFVLASSSR